MRRALICAAWLNLSLPRHHGLRIVTYHGVSSNPRGRWEVGLSRFEDHLRFLRGIASEGTRVSQIANNGPQVMPGTEAVAITFDDGVASHYDLAANLLAKYGMTATFFIPTGFIRKARYYCDLFNSWMMSWDDIRSLHAAGFDIGSHSRTHQVLGRVTVKAARDEILRSKLDLEDQLGEEVVSFAYPYGSYGTYNLCTRNLLAEAGYRVGCTQTSGPVTLNSDMLQLPRVGLEGDDSVRILNMKIRGAFDFLGLIERIRN